MIQYLSDHRCSSAQASQTHHAIDSDAAALTSFWPRSLPSFMELRDDTLGASNTCSPSSTGLSLSEVCKQRINPVCSAKSFAQSDGYSVDIQTQFKYDCGSLHEWSSSRSSRIASSRWHHYVAISRIATSHTVPRLQNTGAHTKAPALPFNGAAVFGYIKYASDYNLHPFISIHSIYWVALCGTNQGVPCRSFRKLGR